MKRLFNILIAVAALCLAIPTAVNAADITYVENGFKKKLHDNGDGTYSVVVYSGPTGTVSDPAYTTSTSSGTPGMPAPAGGTQMGGTDGTNLRIFRTDTTGNIVVVGDQLNNVADTTTGNLKIGCVFSTSSSKNNISSGRRADAQCDSNGDIYANIVGLIGAPVDTATQVILPRSQATNGAGANVPFGVLNYWFDGTSVITSRGDLRGIWEHGYPQGTITDGSGTVTTGGTSQQIFAANTSRTYLFCQNPVAATEVLFVNIGTAASTSSGAYELAIGGTLTFSGAGMIPTGTVNLTATTTGHRFVCKQG